MAGKLKVTQIKSGIGHKQDRKDTLRALGFKRLHQTVEHDDKPEIRGMIRKVQDLVRFEEV